MKNYRWLIVIFGVAALGLALIFAAAFGGGITYYFLRAEPAQAAFTDQVDVGNQEGVLISSVKPESSAAKAGLVRGDIILEIDGDPVNHVADMKKVFAELEPGDRVELLVLHGDETRFLEAKLDDIEGFAYLGVATCDVPKGSKAFPGDPMGEVFIEKLAGGAQIMEVVPESPAAAAGLQVGDVIVSVDEKSMGPETDLADLIQKYAPGDEVTLMVLTEGTDETREVVVTLEENPDDPEKAYLGVAYQMGAPMGFKNGEFPFGELPEDWEGEGFPFGELPEGWEERMPRFFFHHGEEFEGELPEGWEDRMPHFFNMPELPEGFEGAVIISEVMEDTPAHEAGLQPGDMVTAVDGESVDEIETFVDILQSRQPGDEVTLTLIREDQEIKVEVTLTEHPDDPDKGFLGVLAGTLKMKKDIQLPDGFNHDFEFELPGVPEGDA